MLHKLKIKYVWLGNTLYGYVKKKRFSSGFLTKRNIVSFWYTKRVNCENLHYFGVYTTAMGFVSYACWFLLIKTLLIKNNKKGEAALKNEAGGDEKHVCFFNLGLNLCGKAR